MCRNRRPYHHGCDGWRKEDCFYWFAVTESRLPNVFQGTRQSDESQGITFIESIPFTICDSVGYCDPHQESTLRESTVLDGVNGRMNDGFRGIFRGFFMIDTIINVDSGCEVRNILRRNHHTNLHNSDHQSWWLWGIVRILPFTENLNLYPLVVCLAMILVSNTTPSCWRWTSILSLSLFGMRTINMAIDATAGSILIEECLACRRVWCDMKHERVSSYSHLFSDSCWMAFSYTRYKRNIMSRSDDEKNMMYRWDIRSLGLVFCVS